MTFMSKIDDVSHNMAKGKNREWCYGYAGEFNGCLADRYIGEIRHLPLT